MGDTSEVAKTFRALVESADRKFTRVRDVPSYSRGHNHYFHKVFKSYTRLWKFQQENRSKLVEAGLQRWEIGEIASRIGQLYYGQYLRTSEARFLLESYIFYAAILDRGYFQGPKGVAKDLNLRYKELRFYARFLVVSLLLNRSEMVQMLVERFKDLVDDSKATFRENSFKEWKLVAQEVVRFLKADIAFINARPLRYCAIFDSHPTSLPYVARFHAKKVLKLKDALLMSYHWNEVKFIELTLDTFRMLQCLEWEPSGSFFQKRPVELTNNGASDQSGASGIIDINLAMDMTDSNLPPNPKKTILYRPSVTHLISVLATLCEELPPESVLLLYISASGKAGQSPQMESSKAPRIPSNMKVASQTSHDHYYSLSGVPNHEKGDSSDYYQNSLWLGPRGSNNLYPGDIIPFTRRPLFLIIDSDNSHAFKVVHSAERGEATALLLSPARPVFRNLTGADLTQNGSQFTFFLSCPLQAFCQLVGLSTSDTDAEMYSKADNVLSTAFSEWEVILCKSTSLDLVWAQVLSDPFLRRLILRFIFCRSVLSLFRHTGDNEHCLPDCLPCLPDSVSSSSGVVQRSVLQLAHTLGVADFFQPKHT
ncbi:protein SCAI-like isoform X1 [Macadamia integrifolia]|uniref:protein SCAI-like isoform X1 n=1 Tax=Macadamia integrifolia TaxID=60698 RepID=UPI001C4E5CBE|nr:protein SCAI-like isoform X1 [Macadamia integrifolia]